MIDTLAKTKEFIPEVVGADWRAISQAKRAWKTFSENTSDLYDWAVSYSGLESLPVDEFITLVTEKEPKYVVARLLELSGKAPQGFKLEVLIEKGLIDNEYEPEVFAALDSFKETRATAQKLFPYDILKLYQDEYFDLDEQFEKALEEKFTVYTKTENENEALSKFKDMADLFNWFSELGLAKPKMGINGLNSVLLGIKPNDDRSGYTTNMGFFNLIHWKSLNR